MGSMTQPRRTRPYRLVQLSSLDNWDESLRHVNITIRCIRAGSVV